MITSFVAFKCNNWTNFRVYNFKQCWKAKSNGQIPIRSHFIVLASPAKSWSYFMRGDTKRNEWRRPRRADVIVHHPSASIPSLRIKSCHYIVPDLVLVLADSPWRSCRLKQWTLSNLLLLPDKWRVKQNAAFTLLFFIPAAGGSSPLLSWWEGLWHVIKINFRGPSIEGRRRQTQLGLSPILVLYFWVCNLPRPLTAVLCCAILLCNVPEGCFVSAKCAINKSSV